MGILANKTREAQALERALERTLGFGAPAIAPAGVSADVVRRIERLEFDQQRLRTDMEAPDPLLIPDLEI